jgi:hypothetical protein
MNLDKALNKLSKDNRRVTEALLRQTVVKSERIERFQVIRKFERIEIDCGPEDLFDEKDYKFKLLEESIKLGGNAIYDYKESKHKKE